MKSAKSTTPTLVAHGGFLCDFLLLIINCMKYNVDVAELIAQFIDSMKMLQEYGMAIPNKE